VSDATHSVLLAATCAPDAEPTPLACGSPPGV